MGTTMTYPVTDNLLAGIEALLNAVRADDPKREILVRIGDIQRDAKRVVQLSDERAVALSTIANTANAYS